MRVNLSLRDGCCCALLPHHPVPYPDLPTFDHLGAGASSPVRAQDGFEARAGFVHPLAGGAFGEDAETAGADSEDLAAGAFETDAGDEEVGAAGGGIEILSKLGEGLAPGLLCQEDHLAAAPLVGIAHQALAGPQGGGLLRIHGAALESLQPDGADFAFANTHFTGSGDVNTESGSVAGTEMSPSSSL